MSIIVKKNQSAEGSQGRFSFQYKGMVVVVWLSALIVAYFMIQLGIGLYSKYQLFSHPQSLVYGTWIEDKVAPYAAEHIVINSSGVLIDGGVVDTQFNFDGETLRYQHGTQERVFRFNYENWNEMTLETKALYQPVYVKSR